MKISKIKKLPSGKYNLTLDNKEKIITYDEVILKNNLLYNQNIDNDILMKLHIDTKHYDIYNKVFKLISVRLRSEKEINDYLSKNNIEEDEKQAIIASLKENGIINDQNFARAYILDKINFSNSGPLKISQELKNHNIDVSIINAELNNIDSSIYIEKIKKFIDKKVKTNKKYSNYILKQKILSDLINMGFYQDDINFCLNNISVSNDNLIDNAYDKLYKKLYLKYDGMDLNKKIKEKLYQKGYSLSEIDNIISKKNI